MKAFLTIVGGFVLTLSVFAGGAAFAIFVLGARPAPGPDSGPDLASAWSDSPRPVDVAAQEFERLPPRAAPADPLMAQPAGDEVDRSVTASLRPEPPRETEASAAIVAAHVDWCAERYRSYRPRDDSYTPYRGGRKRCISPHSDALAALEAGSPLAHAAILAGDDGAGAEDADAVPLLGYASAVGGARMDAGIVVSSAHARNCFARYRSYRADDNSYQPHGGGPRRQCGASAGRGGTSGQDGVRPRRGASATAMAANGYATRPRAGRHPTGRPAFDPHRGGR